MKLSRTEVLRRAVVEAHHAAGLANNAAWRARVKMDVVVDAAKALVDHGSLTGTLKTFIAAEVGRLHIQSANLENSAWSPWRELGDLAELMGAGRDEP